MEKSRIWGSGARVEALTVAHELELHTAYKSGNLAAGHELVMRHLSLAKVMARKRSPTIGADYDDHLQQAVIGLMHALDRFDPAMGYRFSTYARHWSRAEVFANADRMKSVVKPSMTQAGQMLRNRLPREKSKRGWYGRLNSQQVVELATHFNVTTDEIREASISATRGWIISIDVKAYDENDTTIGDLIADESVDPSLIAENIDGMDRLKTIRKALEGLSARESDVIKRRMMVENPETLEEICKTYNVSRERIRQIEVQALQKIKNQIEGNFHLKVRRKRKPKDKFQTN